MEVELRDDKPGTTANFLRYLQGGLYRDMFFHRWVPGFVIQGGGFFVTNRQTTNAAFAAIPTFSAITNEFGVGQRVSNTYGTIAMAKTALGPDTATSQWFFNLADNSANLDNQNGGFTVFGRVVQGTNVLDRFNNTSLTNGLWILQLSAPLDQLPVRSQNPTYEDLVYCDISLLNVHVNLAINQAREISWDSVAGRTNRVEFTTNMPPVWNLLTVTNGNGTRLEVTDSSTESPKRFYRVRVDF